MLSKTPKFDKALDEYFGKLELDEKGGQWRACRFSGEKFYIRPEDVEFYKKIRVPLPTLRPEERNRRRLASTNSYHLFNTKSAFSKNQIIATYPPDSPYKVYEHQVWNSDKWDPLDYGRDYEATNSFFEQFHKLQSGIPRPNLITDKSNINSEYTNTSKELKNCYFVFDQIKGEDLYYHQCCFDDKNCMESWALDYCDTCYGCKFGERLFNCFFVESSDNCSDSRFLWDCNNCSRCFMSSNLRNKKYYFRNEYVGKEEYEKRMKDVYLGSFSNLNGYAEEFDEMKRAAPRKPFWNKRSNNVIGNFIYDSKNVYMGTYVQQSENVAYASGLHKSRDTYDSNGANLELCYEMHNIWEGDDYLCKFSTQTGNSRYVEYSDICKNCQNCFGCVGLNNKKFCFFNKQYSEEDYWRLVDETKTKMLVGGEYGEFFPPKYLVPPYRLSVATAFIGFDDYEKAGKFGYNVYEAKRDKGKVDGEIIKADDLSDDIKNFSDDILSKIIFDEKNDRYFRYIKQEIDFYRKYGLPLPREHPSARMHRWYKDFDIRITFYKRICAKCGKEIHASYSPERPEIVYCEECYNKEIA